MNRYSLISRKFPRELVLLQGTGCRWRRCTFCDYYEDVSDDVLPTNVRVLQQVTGVYGVLDVINSGSAIELDEQTLREIKELTVKKQIHTLWFEMHYMYRHKLKEFAAYFAPTNVKYRCGIESFSPSMRKAWNKGVPENVTPVDVARYFQGVCLLCCTEGDSQQRIINDIDIAKKHFEYLSVNVFCNNSTPVKQDVALARWFVQNLYQELENDAQVEVLVDNTDLGVGSL